MRGGVLIKEARLRAGLTQTELAKRIGTTQSVIARWETGAAEPAFRTVVDVIRGCGLELRVGLVDSDDHDLLNIRQNLTLTPPARVDQLEAMLELLGAARSGPAPDPRG